ncbi:MAG: hypothetical protein ABEI06_05810 [Halobacteriaceae archaeon]
MASKNLKSEMEEECSQCEQNTPHDIAVKIETESSKNENAEFSREPYRVAECQICGNTQKQRMNNA